MRRLIAGLIIAVSLAGCASFGLNDPAPSRGLDLLNDNLGLERVVFDLPRGLGAPDGASSLVLDLAGPPRQQVKVKLVEADADDVAASLPPPATGRADYVFEVSATDRSRLEAAQQAARSLHVAADSLALSVVPGLCASGPIDPQHAVVSVLLVPPTGRGTLSPISRQRLADLLAASGLGALPACS